MKIYFTIILSTLIPLLILLQLFHASDIQHLHEFQDLFIAVHQGFEPGLPHNLPVEKDVPKAQLRDIVLEHLYQYRVIPFECDEPYDRGNPGYLVTQSCIVLVFILVYLIYPADLCPEGIGICTHVLVFEGAGDILLKDSRNFQLLDVESKYDSVTEFRKVEFGIARKGGRDEARFGRVMDRISELIDRSTLVVCWKDVDDEDLGNGKSEYAERTRRELLERGVSPALLNVTYYGSADNKSTNSYRDAQQIVLCGDWSLVNAETAKIRRAYGTTTTPREHKEWYFSQLITRIGIRKHEKGSYTVFYTDDFDERFIAGMELYFNGNKVPDSGNRKQKDWKDKLEGMKIRSNLKDEIILLAKYDRDMQNAIVMEQEYTKEATFYYLEEILGIKRCARERIRYKSLINTLSRMKITLLIK